ncbi:PIG-L family deacetylase [Actinoplanes ianthinogenes]|uniref:PIG-L family deacetylase n=1 Tax=Actinoplanes ianthinogenes TaxID=122358 RepID=UPI001E592C3D|nr:PIG-L family deacetylase [Actinoplanes ianthinogenes]
MTAWLRSLLGGSNRRGETPGAWQPGPAMTVVAHPDDDLYFINPGVRMAIAADVPTVGVVLTAAEGDGRNVDTNDQDRQSAPVDHAAYSTARHVGLRRAYARMAELPADSEWVQEAVTLAGGLVVERDTLKAAPHVVLYFFNLAHRQGETRSYHTFPPLLDGEIEQAPTLSALDLATPEQKVARETLLSAVVELIEKYRPTVIRTLDPDPEHDWGRSDYHNSDHPEHTATARLTIEAVHRVSRDNPRPPVVEYYRAYANRYWPYNLSKRIHQEKADFLSTYAGADGAENPGFPYGHGDYQLGTNPYRSTHIYSTAQRYVSTSTWLTRLPSGALAAFAVLGDRLAMWSEQKPGSGKWQGPVLTGDGLMPTLAVAANGSGPVRVVALRRTDALGKIDVEAGYFTVGQHGDFSGWQSLDGPDRADPDRRKQREIGVPGAVVDPDGYLWVFLRDFTGGLSVRRQTSDGWQPWESLGGGPLQDGPVATVSGAGLVQVFVPAKRNVAHWRQTEKGGPLVPFHTLRSTPVASGGLHVARTAGDRPCLLFRQAGTGTVLAYREHEEPGTWPGKPAEFGGYDGLGPIAAIDNPQRGAGDLLLAQRNRFATVSVSVHPTPAKGSRWRRLPGPLCGGPSLATDQTGRAVLAVLGQDGRLHVCRQDKPEAAAAFGAWTTV